MAAGDPLREERQLARRIRGGDPRQVEAALEGQRLGALGQRPGIQPR